MRWLSALAAIRQLAWVSVIAALTCVKIGYSRSRSLVRRAWDESTTLAFMNERVAIKRQRQDRKMASRNSSSSSPSPSPPTQHRVHGSTARQTITGQEEDTGADHARSPNWSRRRMRRETQTNILQQPAPTNRVDYLVYAQIFEVNSPQLHRPHLPPQPIPPQPFTDAANPPSLSTESSSYRAAAGDSGNLHTTSHQRQPQPYSRSFQHQRGQQQQQPNHHGYRDPQPPLGPRLHHSSSSSTLHPPNFAPEDHAYIHGRLPMRQPVSAQTVINHFRRLPFLYQDLAEGCRSRASELAHGVRDREVRLRMAGLAQRLADKYQALRIVLPRSYMHEIISRWQSEPRTSKFWEKVLDETEKANSVWTIVRLWILLFIIQSSLVAVAYSALPTSGQGVLLVANALAYIWSTTVMCEMLHARYVDVKADEQELHDLIGGLRA